VHLVGVVEALALAAWVAGPNYWVRCGSHAEPRCVSTRTSPSTLGCEELFAGDPARWPGPSSINGTSIAHASRHEHQVRPP
jgi:hypothetical protein